MSFFYTCSVRCADLLETRTGESLEPNWRKTELSEPAVDLARLELRATCVATPPLPHDIAQSPKSNQLLGQSLCLFLDAFFPDFSRPKKMEACLVTRAICVAVTYVQ